LPAPPSGNITAAASAAPARRALARSRWRLWAGLMAALLAMVLVTLAMSPTVTGLRQVVALTARSSAALFLLAFAASALARRWPAPATRWLLAHRRALGLAMAGSHGLHALALVGFATLDPVGFAQASPLPMRITGGIGYALLLAMVLTSTDAARARLGARACGWLHGIGMHWLWLGFTVGFARRLPISPLYALPVALLLAVLALRGWPRSARAAP
jgi:DMSO/TMAO reductase YedYZ heme-binding membrane subunit